MMMLCRMDFVAVTVHHHDVAGATVWCHTILLTWTCRW